MDSKAGSEQRTKAEEVKEWRKMEAKVRRLCERTSTGKIQVTADVHELWLKAGQTRDNLIQLMADSDGNKDSTS